MLYEEEMDEKVKKSRLEVDEGPNQTPGGSVIGVRLYE